MFISYFNRMFARHGRLAFLLIGIIIVFPFVFLWSWPGRSMGDRGQPGDERVGTMYGHTIPPKAFRAAMHATEVTLFLETNGYILLSQNNRAFGMWVRETLKRLRALREVHRLGLETVSDQEVSRTIREMPFFQEDGRFERSRLSLFVQNFLRGRDMDGAAFDQITRENIAIKRLEAGVTSGVFVSPQEVRESFNRSQEKFVVARAGFNQFDFMKDAEPKPSEAEVSAYFTAHQQELRLPDQKRVRLVEVDPAAYRDKVQITAEEIQEHYSRNQARYEKDNKTLEAVRGEIEEALRRTKSQKEARAAVDQIRNTLTSAREKDAAVGLAALFAETSKTAGLEAKDVGPFTDVGEAPGLGNRPVIQRSGYALTEKEPLSAVMNDAGKYCLACWLETITGEAPKALDEAARKVVADRLLDEAALRFYQEKVERYRGQLATGKTPDDLKKDYASQAEQMKDRPDEQKAALKKDYDEQINTYLVPYYVPEQKRARVAVYSPDDCRAGVTVTEDAMKEYHAKNRSEFAKEEVRVRQIVLRAPPTATPEQKAETKARLETLRAQIQAGADFAMVAGEHSADVATKGKGGDLGFFGRGSRQRPVEEAAFALETGEISAPVEVGNEYYLLKLDERRSDRPFEEARIDVQKKMMENETARLAQQAATKFADKVYDALEQRSAAKSAADLFGEVAAAEKAQVKDTDWFKDRGMVPPIGFETELARQAHKLSASRPLSEVIKGQKDFYVACWMDSKPAYLPEFGKESGLERRVRGHLTRETALRLAREKSRKAHADIVAKLEAGEPFDKAVGEVKFEEVPEFTREQPPSKAGADGRAIADAVASHAAGSLLEPIETSTGAVLVFLRSRAMPTDEEFDKAKASAADRLRREKEGALLNTFYKGLEDESKTVLAEQWQARLNPASP